MKVYDGVAMFSLTKQLFYRNTKQCGAAVVQHTTRSTIYCRSETRQEFRRTLIPKVLATSAKGESDSY